MYGKLFLLTSFVVALNLGGYVCAAEADIEIPSVGYPKPILDGVVDDAWLLSTEQVMTLFTGEGHVSVEPTSPEDCSGSWWALWDEEYLYVLVNVNDEALVQDSDPSQGWDDDRVEIFIDGDNAKGGYHDDNDYQYNFRWNFGEVETPVELYNSPRSLQGVEYGVATTDSGFLVEAKLPWSTMTGDIPQEDQLIGINVMIDDDDDGGGRDTQLRWLMEAGRPHIPSEWGTAMLIADKRIDVTAPGDAIQGVPNDGETDWSGDFGWPPNEHPALAIDDDVSTKYLHFKGEIETTGIQVTPAVGPTIVTGLTLTTANDEPPRDPVAFELSGSNGSIDGPYELIASGDIVDFAQADAWPRYTMSAKPIVFDNDVAYAHYQLLFPAVRDPGSANSMQIAEVELLGVPGPAGPIGHWKLDEGEGAVAVDSSGGGNDGIIQNADTGGLGDGGSVWVDDPERGMVISFSGDDSGAYVSTDLIIPFMSLENDFTWAFWAKQHADQETNNDLILGNRYGGTEAPLQFIKFTPTRFEFFNDDYDYLEGVNYEPVPGDVWVHHVTVKNGTSLTYYRNGEEAGASTITKTIDPNPFSMGGDATDVVEMWRGYLSDVRLYDRALSADEVGQLAGKAVDPSLVIYYSFDEVSDIVTDQSGKGHDGVVVGDVTTEADGMHNGAANFATGSYLDLDGPGFPAEDIPTSAMTLAAWIKCANTGDHHALFNARASDQTWLIHPEARSNGEFRWLLRSYGGTTMFDIRAGAMTWDEWLHFAGTYDEAPAKAALYINGELVSELDVASPDDIAGDWGMGARVGKNIDDARPFTGLMDEFRMYVRALSQDEILEIMQGK